MLQKRLSLLAFEIFTRFTKLLKLRSKQLWAVEFLLFAAALAWLAAGQFNRVLNAFGQTTVDDAGITYSYAENLVSGHGLRLTPGTFPTEGYSNFLQVLLLVPFAAAGFDLDRPAKWINVGATTLALLVLIVALATFIPRIWRWTLLTLFFLIRFWPGFEYWTAQGLEGGLLTAFQSVGLVTLCFLPDKRATNILGAIAGLSAWIRPEAAIYGLLIVLASAFNGRKTFIRAASIAGSLVLLLMIIRWSVFRDVVPNTYWAKSGDPSVRDLGITYLTGFWQNRWTYFLCGLALMAFGAKVFILPALVAVLQGLFALLFAFKVGGDWMHEWRFIQPVFGPLLTLNAFGLVALVRLVANGRAATALPVVAAPFLPLIVLSLVLPPWETQASDIAKVIDASFEDVRERGKAIERMGHTIGLQRPLLTAEPDVGGMAYRSGVQVIDVVGLADRNIAKGRKYEPATLTDYFFGEVRPDFILLHGPWFNLTGLDRLPAFNTLYRKQSYSGPRVMEAFLNEITDPMIPPVSRIRSEIPGAHIYGVSAVDLGESVMLYLHGLQADGTEPAPVKVEPQAATSGESESLVWHLGRPSLPMRPGSSILASGRVPKRLFPVRLDGGVVVESPPLVNVRPHSLEEWLRLPLLRISGKGAELCDPTLFIYESAERSKQVRTAAWLAQLCRGLIREVDRSWYNQAMDVLRQEDDPQKKWLVARASMRFFFDKTVAHRAALDESRADFSSFDEVSMSWVQHYMIASDFEHQVLMLLFASRPDEALNLALSLGLDGQLAGRVICSALSQMAIKHEIVGAKANDCRGVEPILARPHVQLFEEIKDASLAFTGDIQRSSIGRRAVLGQNRTLGGQGRRFLNTFLEGFGDEAVGEVVWTTKTKATIFGALVGGGNRTESTSLVVEMRSDGAWIQVAQLTIGTGTETLTPHIAALDTAVDGEVRVRIIDRAKGSWGHLLVDQVTFMDAR